MSVIPTLPFAHHRKPILPRPSRHVWPCVTWRRPQQTKASAVLSVWRTCARIDGHVPLCATQTSTLYVQFCLWVVQSIISSFQAETSCSSWHDYSRLSRCTMILLIPDNLIREAWSLITRLSLLLCSQESSIHPSSELRTPSRSRDFRLLQKAPWKRIPRAQRRCLREWPSKRGSK